MSHQHRRVPERRRRVLTALRLRARTQRRFRRGAYLLPSMLTMANMFCGYACVVFSMRGEFTTAALFIGIAIVLDLLDGRIARLTGTSSPFGLEFDSLADVISFGIAPAILSFRWGLEPLGRSGWAAGFLFVSCAAMRLARFNIQSPGADKRFFVGLPSPAAASVPASTVFMLAQPEFFPNGITDARQALPVLAMVIVPGLLMVSTIRFRSFKTLDLGSRRSYRNLIVFAALLVALVMHPQAVLAIMSYTYLLAGLIAFAISRVRRRPPSASQTPESTRLARESGASK
ncbi:MAG: CDP-diacylglycerol--serine O-phosphatidyltransferase [Acidobacteria bacterium]|nr:CDP-diacylglycerol--serine O-phosphatidyltransferase [Acidobacteriota bacterium]